MRAHSADAAVYSLELISLVLTSVPVLEKNMFHHGQNTTRMWTRLSAP